MDMPFNILGREYESVLKHDSGIKDWKEDLANLHNQLQREQAGTCAGQDFKQKKRDKRKLNEKLLDSQDDDEKGAKGAEAAAMSKCC